MRNIGDELRQRREELGISLEEMSDRTKIAVERLKAIEAGDITYFDDDISYLKYYIRFYCNALGVDFNQYRDDLETSIGEFYDTKQLQKIELNQELEKSIQKQAKRHSLNDKLSKKVDMPVLTMIIIILILVIVLISVFFAYVLPQLNGEVSDYPQSDPIIADTTDDQPADTTGDDTVTVPAATISVTELDSRTYQISGWQEGTNVSIKIKFGSDTWIKVSYDGTVTDNPASKIYAAGSEVEILYAATGDGEVVVNLGLMKDNTIFVNDEQVTLDQDIVDWNSGIKLKFVFEGENNESAQ